MVVYNRSANLERSRLARASRRREPLRLRVKLPAAAAARLGELHAAVMDVLQGASGSSSPLPSSSSTSSSPLLSSSISPWSSPDATASSSLQGEAEGPRGPLLVAPGSAELVLSRLTDAGLELVIKVRMCAAQVTGWELST